MRKRSCLALALALVTLLLAGCGLLTAKEKVFTKEGLTVTLTDKFEEDNTVKDYTVCYRSTKVIMLALREEKQMFADNGLVDLTLDDYAQLVMEANGWDSPMEEHDGLLCYTYDYTTEGQTYTYFTTVHEGSDAFWLVQFACQKDQYESLESSILQYAKSVIV